MTFSTVARFFTTRIDHGRNASAFMMFALLLSVANIAFAATGAPSSLATLVPDRTIYVDKAQSGASDSNPGTASLPLRTIGAAAQRAQQNNANGLSTKVRISSGTYREKISLPRTSNKTDAAIIFEAAQPGTVVISGSDVWTGWSKNGDTYSRNWPYRWGLAPNPWPISINNIMRRREVVFVNGTRLKQVLSFSALQNGTFYVSESEQRIYIKSSANISSAKVEVGVRSGLFIAAGRTNIVLKGITFQHDTTAIQKAAVQLIDSQNILIEDCQFVQNNWGGLSYSTIRNVTSRRNTINHNGGGGWATFKAKNLVSEDDETSFNNWRGAQGGETGWGVAGTKHFSVHDGLYRRHKAIGNETKGFWMDSDNENIRIEDSLACNNLTNGYMLEVSQGPIVITDTTISHNQGIGLVSSYTGKVTLKNSRIYSNNSTTHQIQISSTADEAERFRTNWETGATMSLKAENWTLSNNTISAKSQTISHLVNMGGAGAQRFVNTLSSNDNAWYRSSQPWAFIVRVGSHSGLDFSGWKSVTGQDSRSTFGDPSSLNLPGCNVTSPPPPPSDTTQVTVDNKNSNTTRTGTWKVSSGPNPWSGESLYSDGGGTFRWTPNLSSAGNYEVYAWWTYHANRSTNVPYRVRHASQTATVNVNQRDSSRAGRWILLGTYGFNAGNSGYVEVSSQNGQASADAVRLIKVSEPSTDPQSFEVDNKDANTSRSGTWKVSSGPNPWAGESLYGTGSAKFRWLPNFTSAGRYEVFAWWTHHVNRATNVPYRVSHAGGIDVVTVNQRDSSLGGRWQRLGAFDFAGSGYVEVSGENGQASADAVRFVPLN